MTENSTAVEHSALYVGSVWHRRLKPRQHEFTYQVYMAYLDLAELEASLQQSRFWGEHKASRFSSRVWPPVQFRREDYFRDFDLPLDAAIRQWVGEKTGQRPTGPIRMLANLRCWGFLINPIVCYYLFDESGSQLQYLIAEVTNTPWRERVQYLLAADEAGQFKAVEFDKTLHVSPFHGMDMHYCWHSSVPGQALDIRIDNQQNDETVFNAQLTLQRLALTPANQRAVFWRHPWMTAKVGLAIYWQALKLFLKRVPLVPHPKSYARNG